MDERETLLRDNKTRYNPIDEGNHVQAHNHHHERHGPSLLVKILVIVLVVLLAILFVFTLLISILSPIIWNSMSRMIAQNALNSAVMTIESGRMSNPRADGVSLSSVVTITQTGAVAGNLSALNATVYYKNQPFAHMSIPPASFAAGAATTFVQTAELTVTDDAVFRQQASTLMSGQSIAWRLSGPITITFKQLGLTLNLDLHIEKEIVLNGGAPQNVTAYNLDVVDALDNNTLLASVSQYLYNPSNIEVVGLGEVVMDSYNEDGIKLGEAIVSDFQILSGDNYQDNVIIKTIRTPENSAAISKFMSNWAMGVDQKTTLVGPTRIQNGGSYFLNVTRLNALMKGYSGRPLVSQVMMNPLAPTQVLYNPVNATVKQNNFLVKSTIVPLVASNKKPLYPAYNTPITGVGTIPVSCQSSDDAGYALFDTTNPNQRTGTVTLPPLSSTLVSLQSDTSFQCTATMPFAMCCGLYSQVFDNVDRVGMNITASYNINVDATFSVLLFDKFNITQSFSKQGLGFQCFPPEDAGFICQTLKYATNICTKPAKGFYCAEQLYDPSVVHWVPSYNTTSKNVTWTQANGTWTTNKQI